jgi:hypothetical protein
MTLGFRDEFQRHVFENIQNGSAEYVVFSIQTQGAQEAQDKWKTKNIIEEVVPLTGPVLPENYAEHSAGRG